MKWNFSRTALLHNLTQKHQSDIKKSTLFWAVVEALASPLGIVAVWAGIFSIIFQVDVFSHLAMSEKSDQIKAQKTYSEDIVVIEFDQQSLARLGDDADELHGIFHLVDRILEVSDPKQVILDYELVGKPDKPVQFKDIYLKKLTWGVIPFMRGKRFQIDGFHPNTFSFESVNEGRVKELIQPWGHMQLGLAPGTDDTVTSTALIKNYKGQLVPSIALAAYWRGTNEPKLSDAMLNFTDDNNNSPACASAIYDTLPACETLVSNAPFYIPPLPEYFPAYSAFDLFDVENSEISNALDGKFVFIASTWERDQDHFNNGISSASDAIGAMFAELGFMEVDVVDGKVPGVYFHASILESLVNPEIGFPAKADLSVSILVGVVPALIVLFLCCVLRYFLNLAGLNFNQEHHYWTIVVFLAWASFYLFEGVAAWTLVHYDLLTSLLLPYLLSAILGALVIANGVPLAWLLRKS